jgi:hypothetical protein
MLAQRGDVCQNMQTNNPRLATDLSAGRASERGPYPWETASGWPQKEDWRQTSQHQPRRTRKKTTAAAETHQVVLEQTRYSVHGTFACLARCKNLIAIVITRCGYTYRHASMQACSSTEAARRRNSRDRRSARNASPNGLGKENAVDVCASSAK